MAKERTHTVNTNRVPQVHDTRMQHVGVVDTREAYTQFAAQLGIQEHGFEVAETIPNYYRRIDPPDCYVLRKTLRSDG